MTLITPVATNVWLMFMHVPAIIGFHIFSRGLHWKISRNMRVVKNTVFSPIKVHKLYQRDALDV